MEAIFPDATNQTSSMKSPETRQETFSNQPNIKVGFQVLSKVVKLSEK